MLCYQIFQRGIPICQIAPFGVEVAEYLKLFPLCLYTGENNQYCLFTIMVYIQGYILSPVIKIDMITKCVTGEQVNKNTFSLGSLS